MTPVRPVGTSSATLPRQRRPLGRRESFARFLDDDRAAPPVSPSVAVSAPPSHVIETEAELALPSPDATVMALRAFRLADAQAAGRMRHSGQVVDVIV